jgi:DNA-binding CsgD family transcriptional regulator
MPARLRKTGIEPMGDLPWGTHFCLFYETKEDLIDTAVPYFKAGLENNEYCVWAVSDPLTVEEATDAIRQATPSLDPHIIESRLEIIPGYRFYLNDNEFDLKQITESWSERLRTARARKCDGIRVSGNAFWLDTVHRADFNAYERQLNSAIADLPMIALCTYCLATSKASDLVEVARAHQFTVVRRRGDWEIVEAAAALTQRLLLTQREREILAWAAKGKAAWEIGKILRIAKRTVDEHVQTAARKLGATNRTQAVAIALQHRLIEPDRLDTSNDQALS